MAVVAPARADCDVPESGVTEDAVPVDFAGVRKSLAESGVAIGGYYAAETFGNPTGGFKQGATYDGVLELHLNADLNKLGLWKGLCFYTDAFQIHGRSITADYVHSFVTVSNIEATPATKLYELWLQQSLFNKRLSVRVGQLAADGDFFVLEGVDDWFLDGSWGWPTLLEATEKQHYRNSKEEVTLQAIRRHQAQQTLVVEDSSCFRAVLSASVDRPKVFAFSRRVHIVRRD